MYSEEQAKIMHNEVVEHSTDIGTPTGVGHVRGLMFLQMAGSIGLINPVWSLFGKCADVGKNGTYQFLKSHHPAAVGDGSNITLEKANTDFDYLFKLLKGTFSWIETIHLETGGCSMGRATRKMDLIVLTKTLTTFKTSTLSGITAVLMTKI